MALASTKRIAIHSPSLSHGYAVRRLSITLHAAATAAANARCDANCTQL
ncbi:MAG: hypothetical protein ACO3IB_01900 [Phycisphaerales bacterium]